MPSATVEGLRATLRDWNGFYDGYDPLYAWWNAEPYKAADTALQGYATLLRDSAGLGDEPARAWRMWRTRPADLAAVAVAVADWRRSRRSRRRRSVRLPRATLPDEPLPIATARSSATRSAARPC